MDIKAKKSLGQNFLIDNGVIKQIVECASIKDRVVLEVGPGTGNLTQEIIEKKPKKVFLIEKDTALLESLKKKLHHSMEFINKDILSVDETKLTDEKLIVFGNLPCNISSQIFVKFLRFKKWPPKFSNLVFMFQKELGLKIIGRFLSSAYGRLSILFHSRFKLEDKFLI